ncbi:aminoglycoside phosphotransferase family protein [Patescibacteria group bacterium]|nr:aminoglycoside phosphotransferase family protein [Patescibacteria group bacterium]
MQNFDIKNIIDKDFINNFFNSPVFQKALFDKQEAQKISVLEIKTFKEFLEGPELISLVVRYTLSYAGKEREIFGVAHVTGLWKPIYQYLKHVYESGFNQGPVQVSKPLGYFDNINTLFYFSAPGEPLIKEIEKGQDNLEEIFQTVGSALGRLHQIPPQIAPQYNYEKEDKEEFLEYSLGSINNSRLEERKKQELRTVTQKIYQQEGRYLKNQSFTHGDFHPKNIIIGDKIYFIDFSAAHIFARESDVGDFLAQFSKGYFGFSQRKVLGEKRIEGLRQKFLSGYFEVINKDDYTVEAINLFEAKTIIKITIHVIRWEEATEDSAKMITRLLEATKEKL